MFSLEVNTQEMSESILRALVEVHFKLSYYMFTGHFNGNTNHHNQPIISPVTQKNYVQSKYGESVPAVASDSKLNLM